LSATYLANFNRLVDIIMARVRTIRRSPVRNRRAKQKKSEILGLFPEGLQAFIARRFVDVFAGCMVLVGLFMLTALMTYSHHDPSWNTAAAVPSDFHVQNWMGLKGAWTADLLLQTLGVGSVLFGLVIMVWGVRTFLRQPIDPLWLRVIALAFAGLCGSVAFAQIPSGGWMPHPYLGSSFGTLVMNNLGNFGSSISPWFGPVTISLVAAMLMVGAGLYAGATQLAEIGYISEKAYALTRYVSLFSAAVIQGFNNWLRHHNDPDYRPDIASLFAFMNKEEETAYARGTRRVRQSPRMEEGEEDEEDEEDEDEEDSYEDDEDEDEEEEDFVAARMPGRGRGAIPVVTPKQAKPQKQANIQQRFSLSESSEDWEFPALSLLESPVEPAQGTQLNESALQKNAELLQNVLMDYNIEGDIVSIHPGPVVTLYELEPAPGVKSQKVISLADDIARSMSAVSVRVAVVPGRNVIGIELPNKKRQIVYMQELLASKNYENTSCKLPLALGKDIGGQPILADLAKMPHLLVAGTTGSGKSVAVNTMILSLLYSLSPEQCRFIMIDPKMLELSVYDGIPHLLAPVVTEPGKAVVALKWTVQEMEERYRAMSKLGVRNIDGYNERVREASKKGEVVMQKVQTGFDPQTGQGIFEEQEMDLSELPYIVVIVDEFADLMLVAGKDVENAIQRLAQMARAAGIHLIMATQRPSVDVITGVIKANFPTRISFQVTSKIDSRTILGEGGAEQLLGMGDMLYMAPGGRITRVHGPFVSDGDVEKVVRDIKSKAEPSYIEDITEGGNFDGSEVMQAMFGGGGGGSDVDELYDQAVALVAREGKASTSFVQRYLQIGYNRAARIIEEMERQGVISKANAVGKREVLINDFSDA
jgi:S-DNA-T family DNA segregation ATPase FtsK/SpoIIIE